MNAMQIEKKINTFINQEGRRPRILLAHLQSDSPDRWTKPLASSLAEYGFDVEIGPTLQTPMKVARLAIDSDVHMVCISLSHSARKPLVFELLAALKAEGGADIRVVAGGEGASLNHEKLYHAGVSLIVNFNKSNIDLINQMLCLFDKTAE
jgi:methylmalonyl-CoA mutase